MRSFNNLGSGINNLNIGTARPRNPVLDQLVQTLKLTGYTESAAEEIASALSVLANYGVLSLTGGSLLGNLMNMNRMGGGGSSNQGPANSGGPTSNGAGNIPSLLNNASSQSSAGRDAPSLVPSYTTSSSDDDGAALLRQLTQTLARTQGKSSSASAADMFSSAAGGSTADNLSSLFANAAASGGSLFGSGDQPSGFGNFNPLQGQQHQSQSPEPQDTQEIEVAENLAGAIIGQQGRGITEIQHMTGANVSVSRRGVYAPGTQNRIVTITGPGSSVSKAAQLVRQKIQEAEQRRAQNSY